MLAELLSGYDEIEKEYLVLGFTHGFFLDCDKTSENISQGNHHSIHEHPESAENLISKELQEGRIAGPFDEQPFDKFHISPIKLQPKKNGSFRLIQNLSSPYDENSINYHISEENSTVSYASIQDAISIIQFLGPNCFMAKSDIKSAFRLIPINPADYPKLGFMYNNQFYYDKCLAQGCSSSCRIFERFSTALEWILQNKFGVKHSCHVLDDFLFLAITGQECGIFLEAWKKLCTLLNIPLALDKTFDPAQIMIFLGIELSTIEMMARLPIDKLEAYREQLQELLHSRTVKLKNMQSAIGILQFSTSVIIPGKAFVRRLIDTTIGISVPYHYVTITPEAKKDIKMWHTFFAHHNGKTLFISQTQDSVTLNLYSDASKKACAATFGDQWFVIPFPPTWSEKNIAFLEFFPILIAIEIFGLKMANKNIKMHCDNKAVVEVINKQSCKEKEIMALMRKMVLVVMQYNIKFTAAHIPGKINHLPDALSRLQVTPQLLRKHGMQAQPTKVPARLTPQNFKVI